MSSPLGGLPRPPMFDASGNFTTEWAAWFNTVHNIAQAVSSSGVSSARPTQGQFVGMPFFDTTLGLPIWLKTPGSSPVWINASGAPV